MTWKVSSIIGRTRKVELIVQRFLSACIVILLCGVVFAPTTTRAEVYLMRAVSEQWNGSSYVTFDRLKLIITVARMSQAAVQAEIDKGRVGSFDCSGGGARCQITQKCPAGYQARVQARNPNGQGRADGVACGGATAQEAMVAALQYCQEFARPLGFDCREDAGVSIGNINSMDVKQTGLGPLYVALWSGGIDLGITQGTITYCEDFVDPAGTNQSGYARCQGLTVP